MVLESESGYGGSTNGMGIFIPFFREEIIDCGGLLERERRGEIKYFFNEF